MNWSLAIGCRRAGYAAKLAAAPAGLGLKGRLRAAFVLSMGSKPTRQSGSPLLMCLLVGLLTWASRPKGLGFVPFEAVESKLCSHGRASF